MESPLTKKKTFKNVGKLGFFGFPFISADGLGNSSSEQKIVGNVK